MGAALTSYRNGLKDSIYLGMDEAASLPMRTLERGGNVALVEARLLRIVRYDDKDCGSSNGRVCSVKTDHRDRTSGMRRKYKEKVTHDIHLDLQRRRRGSYTQTE